MRSLRRGCSPSKAPRRDRCGLSMRQSHGADEAKKTTTPSSKILRWVGLRGYEPHFAEMIICSYPREAAVTGVVHVIHVPSRKGNLDPEFGIQVCHNILKKRADLDQLR